MAIASAIAAIATLAHAGADPIADLLARTQAVTTEVVKLRGIKLARPLEREVVDRAELKRRLQALADDPKTRADTRAEGLSLARWGMVPADTDYLALMVELLTDNVAGYYDDKTRKLTISKGALDAPAWAELVLAHEIVHGLQDQAFGLDKKTPAPDGDAAIAWRALLEGDAVATTIELAVTRQNHDPPWGEPNVASEIAGAMAAPPGDALDHAPLAIREAMLFPYRSGLLFVASILQRETWSAVDAVFKRPPRSSEQVMHPDRYVADDKPIAVALDPPAALTDYTVAHSTVWGELGFSLFLRSHGIPAETAAQAAAGWGGDRVIVLARGDDLRPSRAIGLARLVWDSEADAIEAHEATVRAIDASLFGVTLDSSPDRTRWLALDGTISFVERRGDTVDIAVGVPVQAAGQLPALANK